jgi:hypothetical protein
MIAFLLILLIQLSHLSIAILLFVMKRATFIMAGTLGAILAIWMGLHPLVAVGCALTGAIMLWIGLREARNYAEARRIARPTLYRTVRSAEALVIGAGPFIMPQSLITPLTSDFSTLGAIVIHIAVGGILAWGVYRTY